MKESEKKFAPRAGHKLLDGLTTESSGKGESIGEAMNEAMHRGRKAKFKKPLTLQLDWNLLNQLGDSKLAEERVDRTLSQIAASRKRSQKTHKETVRLRERNRALLAKL